MNSLFILNETYTNGYRMEVLDFISLVSILCGIFVIVSKNPIISVLYLIGLFLSIASYLMILGLNFIGLSYLLVYVGAVSILFLFIDKEIIQWYQKVETYQFLFYVTC